MPSNAAHASSAARSLRATPRITLVISALPNSVLRPATRADFRRSRAEGPRSGAGVRSRTGSGSFGGSLDSGRRVTRLPPDSRERRVAASTASSSAARIPCVSSACSAAAVVPPGDVTAARSDSGVSPPSLSSVAAPSSVWRTSASAVARGSPTSTPASVIASARRNTYAGPDPDNPVTASSWLSGTRTTVPTAPSTRSASSRCGLVGEGAGRRSRPRPCPRARRRVRHRPYDRPGPAPRPRAWRS